MYLNTFDCLVLFNIWFNILAAIDCRNKILQYLNAVVDIKQNNINSLILNLIMISEILNKCKFIY